MKALLCAALLLACGIANAGGDLVFAHPVSAQQLRALLPPQAQQLSQAPYMRGTFVQRKFLRELPAPLLSEGDFLFARALGISWHTRKPFDSEFVLTRDGMLQRDGGNQTVQVSAEQQPGLRVATRLFFALFALDLDALAADFDLYAIRAGERWRIGLRPKTAVMEAAFREALIDGGDSVDTVELRDRNGDHNQIRFQDLEYPAALGDAERAGFGR